MLGADGSITGVPAAAGTSTLAVQVRDATGAVASREYVLRMNAALPVPVYAPPPPNTVPAPVCGVACAVSWGDPHLVTFDGAAYDFQPAGEFVASRSSVDDFEVQVRQEPWRGSRYVSANTAVAARVDGQRVGVYLRNSGLVVLVDGGPVELAAGPAALTGGGSVRSAAGGGVRVAWRDGSTVHVDGQRDHLRLTINLAADRLGKLRGLLGNADGAPADDVRLPDGTAVTTDAPGQRVLGEGWRVADEGSLFDYAPGESTATFTDRDFPYAKLSADLLPAATRQAAEVLCRAAGAGDPLVLDGCVLDVAVSGDGASAAGAAAAQETVGRTPRMGRFSVPAGQEVRLSDATFSAAHRLTLGYSLDGSPTTVFAIKGQSGAESTIIPAVDHARTLVVVMRDESCGWSFPSDDPNHAVVHGTNPYDLHFADGGAGCWRPPTYVVPGFQQATAGNANVRVTIG